jgi:hypothetical protein
MATKYYINKDLYIGDTGKQLKDTTNVGDSLPINAIVEYSGQSVPEGYERVTQKTYEEYVLYNDTNGGTNGNVTLSDSAANYDYMEIYFRSNDGTEHTASQKIYSPNGKRAGLVYWFVFDGGATATYAKIKKVLINGTTISVEGYNEVGLGNGQMPGVNASNNIWITRVVGLKEV